MTYTHDRRLVVSQIFGTTADGLWVGMEESYYSSGLMKAYDNEK